MNADFVQGLVGGALAGFLVLAPIFARLFGATTRPAPDWLRPQADPELLAVAREILAEREANGDEAPSENELVEMIAERVKERKKTMKIFDLFSRRKERKSVVLKELTKLDLFRVDARI